MARQMITCESCGKRYDYLKSEACPNCGAFNYIKGAHQHICGAEDVERIIEMKSAEHDDSQEVVRPDTSIDRVCSRNMPGPDRGWTGWKPPKMCSNPHSAVISAPRNSPAKPRPTNPMPAV